jgi:hypothetical protein
MVGLPVTEGLAGGVDGDGPAVLAEGVKACSGGLAAGDGGDVDPVAPLEQVASAPRTRSRDVIPRSDREPATIG